MVLGLGGAVVVMGTCSGEEQITIMAIISNQWSVILSEGTNNLTWLMERHLEMPGGV
jgi:threonine dehydrogenase-like Zn-dependent dehydrogenase